ncbi:unnamed protein product [Adineta steineri]|uniref:Uncharacterized protein n=1 Tax=Adineta steineri TaxID=433720 RepID=A0A814K9A7_9BILA|nr:unnamed protein product [Adineta steineri]CAF1213325.1 unnamed protein product [Adineta steineri]
MSSSTPLLFQLAHGNRHPDDRFDYIVKHYFLYAQSLHHAHIYVTLYGNRISPDFYDDDGEVGDEEYPSYAIESMRQRILEEYKQRSVEDYEQSNEECSCGEHYWHSIKNIDTKKYDGSVIEVNDGSQLFKLSIQFNYPCIHLQEQADEFQYNMYQYEQNTFIYQLRATSQDDIFHYLLQHLEKFNLTTEMLITQFSKASLDNIKTWNEFSSLCEESIKCQNDYEVVKHEKIIFKLSTMDEPIVTHNCDI